MKKSSRVVSMIFAGTLVISALAGCGSGSSSQETTTTSNTNTSETAAQSSQPVSGDTLVLKAGHVLTEDSPYHVALSQWANDVYEQTEGRVKIDVYANSVLGNERDMIEGLQTGILDITLPNSAPLANFTDAFRVFDLPFLFSTRDEAYSVIDSEIGDNMLSKFDEIGIKGLSIWENGFRYLANSKKAVSTPDDLKGMKIRTMENEIHMASFRAWGADATAMAWGEVYTGLEQGTIDGLENPIGPIYQNKMYEVAKYISMTGHFYCPAPLLISQTSWNKISEDDQKVMLELADKYKDAERELCVQYDDEYIKKMKDEGCEFTEDIDKSIWREAAQPVYDEYTDAVGADLLKTIQDKIAE